MTTPEDQVRKQKAEEVQKSMNFIHESLVVNAGKAKIPENVFVTYFLPYFSGQPVDPSRNVVAEWVGVAGTAMSEVDVVDPAGNVLYTVPAIYDTNVLEIANRQAGHSLADIYQQYELRRAGVPVAASNFLNQNLHQKAGEIVTGEHDENGTSARWTGIMSRYGLAPAAGQQTQASSPKATGGDDDVVYD